MSLFSSSRVAAAELRTYSRRFSSTRSSSYSVTLFFFFLFSPFSGRVCSQITEVGVSRQVPESRCFDGLPDHDIAVWLCRLARVPAIRYLASSRIGNEYVHIMNAPHAPPSGVVCIPTRFSISLPKIPRTLYRDVIFFLFLRCQIS